MKLNLGCGDKLMIGYVNVDYSTRPGVDLVHDLRLPLPITSGAAKEIYAKHIIEHFNHLEWPGILADWVRVLAPGGVLIIEAPDARRCMENFVNDKFGLRWQLWHQVIYGEEGVGMRHQQGFDLPRLHRELTEAGLRVYRARSWHDDHPDHINDPTWHYNLRVEAVKP